MPGEAIRKLAVIVPCFNEADNIRRFRNELLPCFDDFAFAKEFILVDDGSTDDSFSEMEKLMNFSPTVKLVHHSRNFGMGAALRTAFQVASAEAVLTIDSDLTFHPSQTKKLLEAFSEDTACVMGSAVRGAMKDVPFLRKLLSIGVNRIYQILLDRPLTSTSSVFRLYRADPLKKLRLNSTSFDINSEILFKLIAAGEKVVEVPVTLEKRAYGKSKINVVREICNHLWMFGRILWWRVRSS